MPVEYIALAKAAAKLISLGISGWTAFESQGVGKDEAKAFGDALSSLPEFRALLATTESDKHGPLQTYGELVMVAFGEAWRRHWAYNERLAPNQPTSVLRRWLSPAAARERLEQFERCLQAGHFTAVLGEAKELTDIALLDALTVPLTSPWYRALWGAFTAAPVDGIDAEATPMLLLSRGEDRRQFEQHFCLAFEELLATDRGEALRRWLLAQPQQREKLVHRLLASHLSSFRREHVFGRYGEGSGVPRLPLEDIYVEPYARRHGFEPDREPRDKRGPVVTIVEELLSRTPATVIVVLADFGRGKSLTARTLAYRLAARFLGEATISSPALAYPIFIRCQDALKRHALQAESAVCLGQKLMAEPWIPNADVLDAAFQLSRHQNTVVLMDGLDEVQLDSQETTQLFDDLARRTTAQRRFVVFSRPAAVPIELQRRQGVIVLTLEDFTTSNEAVETDRAGVASRKPSQVEQWLARWGALSEPPHPQYEMLAARDLLELCATPVLLFMVAQTWRSISEQTDIKRANVYESFIELTARSKLVHDQSHHPVVWQAAQLLLERLKERAVLPRRAKAEAAIVELLSRVAWSAHAMQARAPDAAFTSHEVRSILKELDYRDKELSLVSRGLLLTLGTSLGDEDPEVHFTHKSFREFLVAKYWDARLHRIALAPNPVTRAQVEQELEGARLFASADQSFSFLCELLSSWPTEDRARLCTWAEDRFNDEGLSSGSLVGDERYTLREAALAIGSAITSDGLAASCRHTLATLYASFWARGELLRIVAPRLRHPQAFLERANLDGADLRGADLRGAKLQRANLRGADLQGANLRGADLRGANLRFTNLRGASLQGGSFDGAVFKGATLAGADLRFANLDGADFRFANLDGAILLDAELEDLERAELERADLDRADLARANFERAELQRAVRRFVTVIATIQTPNLDPTRDQTK